jgi:hypothetical protein
MKILIRFLLVTILSFVVFSGYQSDYKISRYQTGELLVSISLDSITPGSITQKQAASLRKLIISSGGKAYLAKSFDFAIVPKNGDAHFFPCTGNPVPESALIYLRKVKPGDFIVVGNLVLFNNIKYKAVLDPTWTVEADVK